MRTVLLWVVVIAMVGCKRAAPPPGATATTASVAVDAAPPAIDAAPPAPCAGQWAHVDPAFCTTATGPATLRLMLADTTTPAAPKISLQATTTARYDEWVAAMVEEAGTPDEHQGRRAIDQGDLPDGKWMRWGDTYHGTMGSARIRAVVRLRDHTVQCEVLWSVGKVKGKPAIDDAGRDVTPLTDACKSITPAASAAECQGRWYQPDLGLCMTVPPGLAATHDIDLPGVHLWIEPGEAGYDAAVAKLERDATSADGTFTSEVRERGQLAAGIWILYRSSYRGDVGAHYFKAIQRFGGHLYSCNLEWFPKDLTNYKLDAKGHDVTPRLDACRNLHAP